MISAFLLGFWGKTGKNTNEIYMSWYYMRGNFVICSRFGSYKRGGIIYEWVIPEALQISLGDQTHSSLYICFVYQEGAEHEEWDEIGICESASACLSRTIVVRWPVTQHRWLPRTGQHHLLPSFARRTPQTAQELQYTVIYKNYGPLLKFPKNGPKTCSSISPVQHEKWKETAN